MPWGVGATPSVYFLSTVSSQRQGSGVRLLPTEYPPHTKLSRSLSQSSSNVVSPSSFLSLFYNKDQSKWDSYRHLKPLEVIHLKPIPAVSTSLNTVTPMQTKQNRNNQKAKDGVRNKKQIPLQPATKNKCSFNLILFHRQRRLQKVHTT